MSIGRYILSGILTIIPLWVTYIIFEFVLRYLTAIGRPIGTWVRTSLLDNYPDIADWISHPWIDDAFAIVFTLAGLYLLGWFANRVIGRRLIGLAEALLHKVPFVQQVYGGVKKMIDAMRTKPEGAQRVALIDFPSSDMKAVGLVTRVMTEHKTGRKLAVVYVPTTPNPTSGYMEVVPIDKVVFTDWTLDEAMNFIISAGTVAPDRMYFSQESVGDLVSVDASPVDTSSVDTSPSGVSEPKPL